MVISICNGFMARNKLRIYRRKLFPGSSTPPYNCSICIPLPFLFNKLNFSFPFTFLIAFIGFEMNFHSFASSFSVFLSAISFAYSFLNSSKCYTIINLKPFTIVLNNLTELKEKESAWKYECLASQSIVRQLVM
jgi:hypothetical protein